MVSLAYQTAYWVNDIGPNNSNIPGFIRHENLHYMTTLNPSAPVNSILSVIVYRPQNSAGASFCPLEFVLQKLGSDRGYGIMVQALLVGFTNKRPCGVSWDVNYGSFLLKEDKWGCQNDHTLFQPMPRQRGSRLVSLTGCPRMICTVFQKNIKNIKSMMSLIIILVIECLICALHTEKISFTYHCPLQCGMVSLKIDE